jgi:hypothetical protein
LSLFPNTLQILFTLHHNSPDNQNSFDSKNGFQIASYILFHNRSDHISQRTVDRLINIFHAITSDHLSAQMGDIIFLDLRLWIYSPIERLQFVVFFLSSLLILDKIQIFHESISVTKLLVMLYTYFWEFVSDSQTCILIEPKLDSINHQIESSRPSNLIDFRDQIRL